MREDRLHQFGFRFPAFLERGKPLRLLLERQRGRVEALDGIDTDAALAPDHIEFRLQRGDALLRVVDGGAAWSPG